MPDDTTTRATLLSRVRDPEDQAAWNEFDRKYRDLILLYSRRRGLQHWDAEDVRQVVMMSLSRALRGFRYDRSRGSFRGYLGRVVRNAVFGHLARPGRDAAPLDVDALANGEASEKSGALSDSGGFDELDELWEREWMNHHYRLAMQTIRERFQPQSIAVFDRLLAGEGVSEIARHFETSDEAVRKIKQRIRQRLQELIEEQVHEEDASY